MTSSEKFYCCDFSRQAGEQLFATATRADVWLCLEYGGAWGFDAFPESGLPEPVKQHLSGALAAVPTSRVELIRRRTSPGGVTLYAAVSDETQPRLYQFRLDTYEDLLNLDIPAVVSGAYPENASEEPIFMVCTHGRRDISCSRFGMPVYEAAAKSVGELAWQCSHIGGHRFAANLVILPEGICYGRLTPADAARVIEMYRRGEIDLDVYRGRSTYDEPVQAADYFLRSQTGLVGLRDFRLESVQQSDEETWIVQFASQAGGKTHLVHVRQDKHGVQTYKNSADANPIQVPQYRLVEIR